MPELDATAPATQPTANGTAPRPKLKGLLPVPPEVKEKVDSYLKSIEADGFFATPEERRRFINDLTLSWHYGGDIVVLRETPDGSEVLASGDEVFEFYRNAPEEVQQGTVSDHPAVWNGIQIPGYYIQVADEK